MMEHLSMWTAACIRSLSAPLDHLLARAWCSSFLRPGARFPGLRRRVPADAVFGPAGRESVTSNHNRPESSGEGKWEMNMTGRIKNQDSVRTTAVSFALVAGVIACTLCLAGEARGQGVLNNSGRSAITCSSNNGQRVYCNADTRGGVRLVRQISGSSCQQDSTWGYDSRGIWVDRGCRAEFEIAGRGSAFTSGSGGAAN